MNGNFIGPNRLKIEAANLFKWANHSLFFVHFRFFKNKQYKFLQQINVKNVMSIHDLSNMSRLPYPLDQCSRTAANFWVPASPSQRSCFSQSSSI